MIQKLPIVDKLWLIQKELEKSCCVLVFAPSIGNYVFGSIMITGTRFENNQLLLSVGNLTREYKGCIFDFDGTILDTERYHYMTWNIIFGPYGVHLSEEEYIPLKSSGREHIINSVCDTYGIHLTREQFDKAVKDKGEIYLELSKNISESDILPGFIEFVTELKNHQIKTVIASSGKNLHYMLNRFDLEKYFDAVVDGNGSRRPKPAPDIFMEAADLIGCNATNAIVFEDSPPGLNGAVAGGFDAIGIGGIKDGRTLICLDNYIPLLQEIK